MHRPAQHPEKTFLRSGAQTPRFKFISTCLLFRPNRSRPTDGNKLIPVHLSIIYPHDVFFQDMKKNILRFFPIPGNGRLTNLERML